MRVTPLEGLLGAELRGVDLAELSPEEFEQVRQASLRYSVIVLREQSFSPSQHVEFSRGWGELEIRPLGGKPTPPNPDGSRLPEEIVQIIYENYRGLSTDEWHIDASYLPAPPALSLATLRELPGAGGDTMFAGQYAAYEALSDPFKAFLAPLVAVHADPRSDAPPQCHPVVARHPVTDRPSIYVNPMFTTGIQGLGADESASVLAFLYAHQVRPEFVYRHRWQPGDLVVWDNRSVLHYAIKDYGPGRRVLQRTTVKGVAPRALAA